MMMRPIATQFGRLGNPQLGLWKPGKRPKWLQSAVYRQQWVGSESVATELSGFSNARIWHSSQISCIRRER